MIKRLYLDLKQGDKIIVRPQGLELKVVSIGEDQKLLLQVRSLDLHIPKDKYCSAYYDIGIYNFGTKNFGNRCHIRLELPSSSRYEYVPSVIPTEEWKQEMDERFTKLRGWDDAL